MGKLTALKVKSIKDKGRYQDGDGLMLVVSQSGSKSWIARLQMNGKRRDVGLGPYPDVSLVEARERVVETRKQIRQGVDPVELKRASRRLLESKRTFRDEAMAFLDERKGDWSNPKHQAQWLSTMERYVFPHVGSFPVKDVSGSDVRDLLVPIWQAKPETAKRVMQRIVSVLDFAHSRGHRDHEAPKRTVAAGLGKQKRTVKHFAAMPYEQVGKLMLDLAANDTAGRLALQFVILTASRSGEVRGATWGEIDHAKSLWTLPAERMKAGREHKVPLSAASKRILKRAEALRRTGKPNEVIFPGIGAKPLSDMTLTKAMRREVDEKWTVHGFRSSFRDWAAELSDFPDAVAEVSLAHVNPNKTEAAYRRTSFLEQRRKLMSAWAAYLEKS